jgi:hypothetical protein
MEINNFNIQKPDRLNIKLGVHIVSKNKGNDGLYMAP